MNLLPDLEIKPQALQAPVRGFWEGLEQNWAPLVDLWFGQARCGPGGMGRGLMLCGNSKL